MLVLKILIWSRTLPKLVQTAVVVCVTNGVFTAIGPKDQLPEKSRRDYSHFHDRPVRRHPIVLCLNLVSALSWPPGPIIVSAPNNTSPGPSLQQPTNKSHPVSPPSPAMQLSALHSQDQVYPKTHHPQYVKTILGPARHLQQRTKNLHQDQ